MEVYKTIHNIYDHESIPYLLRNNEISQRTGKRGHSLNLFTQRAKLNLRQNSQACIQAWKPYRKKDIDMLDRVQRRATIMIQKLRNISYEMLLKECGLTTLETRSLRGDQIEVFKILKGYENIDINIFYRSRKREGLEDMELY